MSDPKAEFARRALDVGTLEHNLYCAALSGCTARKAAREVNPLMIAGAAMDQAYESWIYLEARASGQFKARAA